MILAEISNGKLVDMCIELDREVKDKGKKLNKYKAEIQKRGLAIMEDQNTKYTKYFGEDGSCAVTDSMSLKVLNVERLKALIPEGIFKQMVTETTETKYDYDKMLEKALKAIFNEDYSFEMSLDEFLDKMSIPPDAKQKKLLMKKLKGDYEKDRDTLLTVLGYDQNDEKQYNINFDVELWYIYKIKNAELISALFPEEGIDVLMKEIRKCIIVESKTAISLDYEKEN